MSERRSTSYTENAFGGSSWGSTWRERRQKRCEDKEYKEQGQSGLGEGSFQTYRTMFGALGCDRFNKRDEKLNQRGEQLECLRRLMRDLELQARGRRQRKDHGK